MLTSLLDSICRPTTSVFRTWMDDLVISRERKMGCIWRLFSFAMGFIGRLLTGLACGFNLRLRSSQKSLKECHYVRYTWDYVILMLTDIVFFV